MSEPIWSTEMNDDVENHLAKFFNWYTYNKSRNDAQSYLLTYLQGFEHAELLSLVQNSPSTDLDGQDLTYCWMARILHNTPINIFAQHEQRLKQHLPKLAQKLLSAKVERKNSKNNLEDNSSSQLEETLKLFKTGRNFLNKKYLEDFTHTNKELKQLKEIIDRAKNTNPHLKDTYDSFMSAIDEHLESKQKVRKKRVKKINVEKVVQKIKFLESSDDLGLQSIDPKSIIGSKFLLTFNTKTRMLALYYCNEATGFFVKGTTIQNFDVEKSFSKTVRKPEIVLADLLKSIVQHGIEEKVSFIKSKQKVLTGRINGDTLLLRVH